MDLKHLFENVPADREAEARVWRVVGSGFAEREPVPSRTPLRFGLAALAVGALVATAAVTSPGEAVVNAVRRTIGIEHATPALFRLPAAGRVLVSGASGTWVVASDGSKRRLGDYAQAAWSPHGLFVVAATTNTLAAIEPRDGTVHWSLARPRIRFPRWGGSRIDTRIAYLTAGRLHVVAGDGTGDAAAEGLPTAARVAPAWQPGDRHVLAYVTTRGRVVVVDPDRGTVAWVSPAFGGPRALAWSRDGRRIALATTRRVVIFSARTGRVRLVRVPDVRAVAFSRDGRLAMLRGHSVLLLRHGGVRTVFAAPSRPSGLVWSPDGGWLLTTLPAADQWIFLGGRRVLAVSHIARQFGGVPVLDGWAPGA